jgi:hypothetical protein
VFPRLGTLLLRRSLGDYPIRLAELDPGPPPTADPEVTFVIGHRGMARLPHLLLTLRSIAGQASTRLDCVVVEQDREPRARPYLPSWVRYVHTPLPNEDMAYSRAWAFNVGARVSRGRLLVLHDNDLLVPARYAAALVERHREGYEIVNLKRFVIYLSETHTAQVFQGAPLDAQPPASIVQNAEAGGSIGVDRQVYFALGGLDEEFIGWGGEDNEFWDRASTRRVYPFGHLPLVHLWHPPQPGKRAVNGRGSTTAEIIARRGVIPVEARIRELRSRGFGNPYAITCAEDVVRTAGNGH